MTAWPLAGEWTLSGWRQNDWELALTPERAKVRNPDVGPVPATVPGSVRGALRAAGIVPDPMIGRQSRLSEWIENRHWSFERELPSGVADGLAPGARIVLVCESLDYAGAVLIDEDVVGEFTGTFVVHEFDVTDAVLAGGRTLRIVFTDVPDGLGQNGRTSRIRPLKPRFSYGWDWTPRIVQTGIPGQLRLERRESAALRATRITADPGTATITVALPPDVSASVRVTTEAGILTAQGTGTVTVPVPAPRTWHVGQPNVPYPVEVTASDGQVLRRAVGFRTITWRPTASAPAGAEDWLCVVNGDPVFLAGVNWVPIRPDYADVTDDEYRLRLQTYRDLGFVLIRVWGGAGRERDVFYELCDELGLLVWQELPLSSSGLDNEPPRDDAFIAQLTRVAREYARDLAHHPSLLLWSGGNELTRVSAPAVPGTPLERTHPTLAAAEAALSVADPGRRFIATSPLGPRFEADAAEFGRGLHHDVHGPWEFAGAPEQWRAYWRADDAVLRSEVGVSGASSMDLLTRYELHDAPDKAALRQLWTHSSGWWLADFDRSDTDDLARWVGASQQRQAEMLAVAAESTLARFPAAAGFVVWLGHDTFPCAVSLSLLDYDGAAKPAALALARVFSTSPHTRSR